MYTECTHCNAVFLITPNQMHVAGGKVRCGQCGQVFVAREVSLPQASSSGSLEEFREAARAARHEPMAPREPLREVMSAAVADSRTEKSSGSSEAEQRHYAAWRGLLGVRFNRNTPEAGSRTKQAEQAAEPEARAAVPPAVFETQPDPVPEPPQPAPHRTQAAPQPSPQISAEEQQRDSALFRYNEAHAAEVGRLPDDAGKGKSVPRGNAGRQGSPAARRTVLLIIGVLVLAGILFGQWLLSDLENLAKFPRLQRYAVSFCETIGCDPPYLRAPEQVEIVRRNVVSHPSYPNALLVTATLVSTAAKPQPYPVMELTLTGLQDQVVEQRRFKPQEYLLKTANAKGTMAPNVPVEVRLEIVDPGPDAVGFQFRFL